MRHRLQVRLRRVARDDVDAVGATGLCYAVAGSFRSSRIKLNADSVLRVELLDYYYERPSRNLISSNALAISE